MKTGQTAARVVNKRLTRLPLAGISSLAILFGSLSPPEARSAGYGTSNRSYYNSKDGS